MKKIVVVVTTTTTFLTFLLSALAPSRSFATELPPLDTCGPLRVLNVYVERSNNPDSEDFEHPHIFRYWADVVNNSPSTSFVFTLEHLPLDPTTYPLETSTPATSVAHWDRNPTLNLPPPQFNVDHVTARVLLSSAKQQVDYNLTLPPNGFSNVTQRPTAEGIKFSSCRAFVPGADMVFQSQTGRTYTFERSPDLSAGSWQDAETVAAPYSNLIVRHMRSLLPTTINSNAVVEPSPTLNGKYFFRVRPSCSTETDCQNEATRVQGSMGAMQNFFRANPARPNQ